MHSRAAHWERLQNKQSAEPGQLCNYLRDAAVTLWGVPTYNYSNFLNVIPTDLSSAPPTSRGTDPSIVPHMPPLAQELFSAPWRSVSGARPNKSGADAADLANSCGELLPTPRLCEFQRPCGRDSVPWLVSLCQQVSSPWPWVPLRAPSVGQAGPAPHYWVILECVCAHCPDKSPALGAEWRQSGLIPRFTGVYGARGHYPEVGENGTAGKSGEPITAPAHISCQNIPPRVLSSSPSTSYGSVLGSVQAELTPLWAIGQTP